MDNEWCPASAMSAMEACASSSVVLALAAALAGSAVTAIAMRRNEDRRRSISSCCSCKCEIQSKYGYNKARRIDPQSKLDAIISAQQNENVVHHVATQTLEDENCIGDTVTTQMSCSASELCVNQSQESQSMPAKQLISRQSTLSEASSIPSDLYFEELFSTDEDYNNSHSEVVDKLGSLKTVRLSIRKRNSLLTDDDVSVDVDISNRRSSASDEPSLQHSSLRQRRRSSTLRQSNRTRNSVCDSMSTLDDEDPASYTIDATSSPLRQSNTFNEEFSYISETERRFKGEEDGIDTIMELATDYNSSMHLLRRSRAISALAHRLTAAPDEFSCIEEAAKLLILLFGFKRVSYALGTGTDHFLLKRFEVVKRQKDRGINGSDSLSTSTQLSFDLKCLDSDSRRPYEGTSAGIVNKTLRESYTPKTKLSPLAPHKAHYNQGVNSILASPILVSGDQCMGVILLTRQEEDAFSKVDRILISDIGTLLGANMYAKRLRKTAEDANKLSREMLHSFIPPKVLTKIEGFWDRSSEQYLARKAAIDEDSEYSPENSVRDKEIIRSNSWYVANTDWSEAQIQEHLSRLKKNELDGKLRMLKKMNRSESMEDVIITTEGMDLDAELNLTSRALYAETVRNVSIVFVDIVGFSKIAMDIAPIKIMNMLSMLFNRFDALCDHHGVMKLETIGDAYLCATNLLEENADDINVARKAALRALAAAKDMIREASKVKIPVSQKASHEPWVSHSIDDETLQIRVGIHVGDLTCGVLGRRLPKFILCGSSVNMAARMEQTCVPNKIRVTDAFHDLIGDKDVDWLKKERIAIKNMGSRTTYLLEP